MFKNYLNKTKYIIKAKFKATENPQANSILEIIHQFIVNLVSTFDLQDNYLDNNEPW